MSEKTKETRIIIMIALLIVVGLGIWAITSTVQRHAAAKLEEMKQLVDSILYDGSVIVGYEDDNIPYLGIKPVADDFKNVFDNEDITLWKSLNTNSDAYYAQTAREQLGSSINFQVSDAFVETESKEIRLFPYENGTLVTIYREPFNEDLKEYQYLAKSELFDKVVAVKNKYNSDTVAEMIKKDPAYSDIYGNICTNNTNSLSLDSIDMGAAEALTAVPNVEYLRLNRCTVSDTKKLGELKKLKKLTINESKLSDFSFLKELTNLETLILTSYRFKEPPRNLEMPNLGSLKKLTEIRFNLLPIADIRFLEGAKNLNIVEITNMSISDISPLKYSNKITYLKLKNTNVSDITVAASMPELETLVLSGTKVTDVSCLKPLKKVDFLTIPFPYNDDIAELQQAWDDHEVKFNYYQ